MESINNRIGSTLGEDSAMRDNSLAQNAPNGLALEKSSGTTFNDAINGAVTHGTSDVLTNTANGDDRNGANVLGLKGSNSSAPEAQTAPAHNTNGHASPSRLADNCATADTQLPERADPLPNAEIYQEASPSEASVTSSQNTARRYYPLGYPELLASILGIPTPENPLAGIKLPDRMFPNPRFPSNDEEASNASSRIKNSTTGLDSPQDRYYSPRFPEELGKVRGLQHGGALPEPPLLVNGAHTHDHGPASEAYKGGRLDALREILHYWESLQNLSTDQVVHEYRALIWWWEKNKSNADLKDERHYQRLADLICVKSVLLLKGVKVDLKNLENSNDIPFVFLNDAGHDVGTAAAGPGLGQLRQRMAESVAH
ncbi:hypothetical protein EV426DRAFT_572418 [Tirmania nivea]|nr:hypothetical protein EV426DRAFT_572418 [Tirmania nivea]